MYDYKLYVSLLIFVYSLMDSDERASLQKKCFERQTVLCACCASDGCCHFTCVICACFNICCNEHVWHVHGALHVVMSKKLEMSIEYLKRATFIIKKEVGGRELTKLWVYSLVLWEPAFALCPVLWRAVRPWLSPIQDIAALWVIQFCAGAACVFALDS